MVDRLSILGAALASAGAFEQISQKNAYRKKTTMSTLQPIPETASQLDALRIVAAEYNAAVADLVDKCQWNSNDDIQSYLHPARKRVELAQKVWRTVFDTAAMNGSFTEILTTANSIITIESMSFRDFSLEDLSEKFGVRTKRQKLFPEPLQTLSPSPLLIGALEEAAELYSTSEKFKAEAIVFPLLMELRRRNNKFFTIYSGDTLSADPAQGLKGECDFMLAKESGFLSEFEPIFQLVEAKQNDGERWLGQCAAQMLGAKIYNEKKGTPLETIYGCVTTGDDWLFLRLTGKEIFVDTRKYYLGQIGELLAAFQHILDYYKAILK